MTAHWVAKSIVAGALILAASTLASAQRRDKKDESSGDYVKVEVRGQLDSHVFAIGGETTGVQVSAGGTTWELDLGGDKKLKDVAERLHEKTVVVTGTLHVKTGVEIPQRRIIQVVTLRAADGGGEEKRDGDSIYLDEDGKLRHDLVLKDAQGGFAGFSGQIITIEPDGSWRRQPFLNANVRKAEAEGKLESEKLTAVAAQLEKFDFNSLPEKMGKPTGVNPHVFTISFGKRAVSLTLAAGAELPKADDGDAPQARFAAIAHAILGAVKTKK